MLACKVSRDVIYVNNCISIACVVFLPKAGIMGYDKTIVKQPTVSVFANFLIESPERLLRMQDTILPLLGFGFQNWVVNVRGDLAEKACSYIKEQVADELVLTSETNALGWLSQTFEMSANLKGDYVLIWLEDHMLMADHKTLSNVVTDMNKTSCDVLMSSWFTEAYHEQYKPLTRSEETATMISYKLNEVTTKHICKEKLSLVFVSSMTSIMTKDYFQLNARPQFIRCWPHETPFDFEISWFGRVKPDVVLGQAKLEIFASIDDSARSKTYSLIDRGLYPNRVSREDMRISNGSTSRLRLFSRKLLKSMKLTLIINLYAHCKLVYYTVRFFVFYSLIKVNEKLSKP